MKTAIILSSLLIGSALLVHKPDTEILLSGTSTHQNFYKTTSKSKRVLYNTMPKEPVRIVVDKSNYELYVYDTEGWFATYPVVFGSSNLADKKMEGDRLTPEGNFKIVNKRVHDKWNRYMGLDYPTAESLAKFSQRKKNGEIPAKASPGGGIGIHGTWPNEDFQVDRFKNWTNGCISLKNEDVQDLYSYVPIGTPITIKP